MIAAVPVEHNRPVRFRRYCRFLYRDPIFSTEAVMRQPAQPSSSDLVLLGEVVRSVVRRGRLPPADAEDFSQGVQLRFLESGYEAFARFDGRSSLRTYLTTVVWRLLLDWRTAAYGKWRPSAAARRLGPQAVRLDRLLNRDGLTVDEAIEVAS